MTEAAFARRSNSYYSSVVVAVMTAGEMVVTSVVLNLMASDKSIILTRPYTRHASILVGRKKNWLRTDHPTDRRTDTTSYRDATSSGKEKQ